MQTLPAAVAAARQKRAGQITHYLIWINARTFDDPPQYEPVGFWTGDHDRQFEVAGGAGVSRTYLGAGEVISVDQLAQTIGLTVRPWKAGLSGLTDNGRAAIRGYDLRLAAADVHTVDFDPATMQPLSAPVPEIFGRVGSVTIQTPAQGGTGGAEVSILSTAWQLTRRVFLTRSAAGMAERGNGQDQFYKYSSSTGADTWGAKG
ncbi:conserved hypothetical protein [Ketogulonicigenium vulgare Y25]|uniref:hypothetical protein n=1 Tax=Ketogulonicigenium vulgare TaxID=92945 RepID=UPI0001E66B35|nr:hypothetical protein [Ketogulonicigenium vulgare]ADO42380.1 conserved hypothetical protein [Ketogulonicigenium vulgare Y25]